MQEDFKLIDELERFYYIAEDWIFYDVTVDALLTSMIIINFTFFSQYFYIISINLVYIYFVSCDIILSLTVVAKK